MTILLHKPYLPVYILKKWPQKAEGGQKFDHVVYGWPKSCVLTLTRQGSYSDIPLYFNLVFNFGISGASIVTTNTEVSTSANYFKLRFFAKSRSCHDRTEQ